MAICAACANDNPAGARFCNACGAPLEAAAPLREERKVVSVVFADLVGSTARAESLDPEDVRAILAPYHAMLRRELERFGGTVEKFIGDAVVAVFGAPLSHEDDAERAVRASLAVQEAITELNDATPGLDLEVRVGVNTGEALVNLSARPELGEAMVSGDVMNTAARLQSAAPPGGIVVGAHARRAVERAIDLEELEPVEAKGKAEPVACWLVLGARARLGMAEEEVAQTPLVGRDREVALLRDAFERVRRDERPQLVTLVGVPGIGKSRLVQELRATVDADPELITWRRGRSLPYGEGVAFWALGEIVKAQAGILESDPAPAASSKLERAVSDLVSEAADAAWVERHLRPLVGIAGSSDAQVARGEAFAARRRFLETLAEHSPAVLVFEDVHWADDDLLDFIDEVADRLDSVPLLVVCTARPELLTRRPAWGGGKLNAVTLSLSPLSSDETRQLLHGLLDRSVLSADEQAAVVERAEGVPLFAEELVRMLNAGEAPTRLPETLQGLVTARVDGLAPAEKALLQDAAVLGKVFWSDALAVLSGLSPDDLDERLRSLERREFVRRERRSAVEGARQYTFLHALVRDAAYGQIPRAGRAAKHRAAAAWIAGLAAGRAEDRAETLAHHLEAAIEYGFAAGLDVSDLLPDARRALREAGDRAWSLTLLARAEHYYARSLGLGGDRDPELLYLSLRARYWSQGREAVDEEAIESTIDALVADGKPELAADACVLIGRARWNRQVHARDLYERAVALVDGLPPSAKRAEVLSLVASYEAINDNGERGLRFAELAVADARLIGDRDAESQALNSRAVAEDALGMYDAAIETSTRALALGLECGAVDVLRGYVNLASLQFSAGLLEESGSNIREGLALARRSEAKFSEDWLVREDALTSYYLGRWRDARVQIAELESAGGSAAHVMDIPLAFARAAIAFDTDGSLAEEGLGDGIERARSMGDLQAVQPILAESALVLARAGRHDRARELLEEFALSADGPRSPHLGSALAAALAWMRIGGTLPPEVTTGPGSWEDATRLVRGGDLPAAADVLAAMGARAHEAWARELAAEQALEASPDVARMQLERATAFFREVGAAAALARVDTLAGALRPAAS